MTVIPDGPPCRCGKKGCVESFAGMMSLVRDAKRAAAEGKWQPADPAHITFDSLIEELQQDNGAIEEIFGKAGKILG